MGKPGRPGPSLDDYLYWQASLENREASGLSIDEFCVAEGVPRSTFYRWVKRLRDGIPDSVREEGEIPTLAAFGPDAADNDANAFRGPPRHESRRKSWAAKPAAADRAGSRCASVLRSGQETIAAANAPRHNAALPPAACGL